MSKTTISAENMLQQVLPELKRKGFRTVILQGEKEVKDFINSHVPDKTIVGLGDSITTCKLNLRHLLASKGTTIFYSWNGSYNYNRSLDTFEIPARPDYYITRINALTTSGELLMKDYDKNAARDGNFPAHVMAFIGLNRLTDKLDDTESRIKYPVISSCPEGIKFTIALLPFLDY